MRIRLDWHGDVVPENGERVIDTETEWLRAALGNDPLLVRGERLCSWAERFCACRGISCEVAISPTKRLKEVFSLSMEEARRIVESLDYSLPEPLTAVGLLERLAPHPTLWTKNPSEEHAALWLLWLYENNNNSPFASLIRLVSREWQEAAPPQIRLYYGANCAEDAKTLLYEWLGIHPSQRQHKPFPVEPPEQLLQEADTAWRSQLVETNGEAWQSLWNRCLHPSVRRKLADTLGDFFANRHDILTAEVLEAIKAYLSGDMYARLHRLIPRELPSEPPEEPEALLDWFDTQYLPYREWQHFTNDENARQQVNKLARLFAERVLNCYPNAILRKDGPLAFMQVNRFADSVRRGNAVALVVILDGMTHNDARELRKFIKETVPDLHLVDSRLVFNVLPTITKFCKEALLTASPPKHALQKEVTSIGTIIPDQNDPAEYLHTAPPGSLFFWRVAEPDETYHKRNRDRMLSDSVRAALWEVAQKLQSVIRNLPKDRPLRLVITSDHGRLMGCSKRQIPPPSGWDVHERAAYLTKDGGRRYEAHGYAIEGDLVYLSPESFGLPYDAVCVLSDESFLDASGKGGTVAYPHGGLYPEEVIVDWLEYDLQPQPVAIKAILRGKGRPRRPASVELEITNRSSIPLHFVGLEEKTERLSMKTPQRTLQPYSQETIPVQIDAFPNLPRELQIDAIVRDQNEELHREPVENQLDAESMYQTEPILEDLL